MAEALAEPSTRGCFVAPMSSASLPPPAMVGIHRAAFEQIPALARTLARAFDRDPFYDWLIPRDRRRQQRLEQMFELLLTRYSADLGETYTTESLDGCAIWKPPGDYKLSLWQQLGAMPAFARVISWRRIPSGMKLIEHMEALQARLAPGPHVYLYTLGVDPARQGRGVGGRLLSPLLERWDAERRDVYLETAREANVPFYERHGFILREVARQPPFPTLWAMTRPSRSTGPDQP